MKEKMLKFIKKNILWFIIGVIGLAIIGITAGITFRNGGNGVAGGFVAMGSAIGAVGTASIYFPQVIKTMRMKKADQLSWLTLIFEMSSNIIWISFTILSMFVSTSGIAPFSFNNNPMAIPLILVNGLCFTSALILFILKRKWQKIRKG